MKSPLGLVGTVLLAALAGAISSSRRADALDLYVAADGRDAWSGRLAAPDAAGKDGPFASLERARDEVRRLKREKGLHESVTVHVRGGTYFLDRTFQLTAEDSGTADAPVVYLGDGAARPLLIGGKPVAGFAPYKDKILVADVASQGLKGVAFRQLFFDGRRQILARYPNFDPMNPYAGGWAYVEGKPVEMYQDRPDDSRRLLHFKAEDARAISRPEEAEVCIFARYNWWNDIVRIASVDREKRVITLAGDCSYAIRPGDRYYVQGLFEELDSPGEWYLDQAAGKLYFWPPAPLEGKAVVAPTLRTIIEIGKGVSDVTVRGFDIECCEGNAVTLDRDDELPHRRLRDPQRRRLQRVGRGRSSAARATAWPDATSPKSAATASTSAAATARRSRPRATTRTTTTSTTSACSTSRAWAFRSTASATARRTT